MIIENIITQHAEESAFLWLLRDAAVRQPHYDLSDITALDNRVEAHIDGLRISGDEGWSVCKEVLAIQEPGETFASAVLAFECMIGRRMDSVITAGCKNRENYRGLLSAIGWIPFAKIESCLQGMLSANSPDYRRLALAGYAIHREDPGPALKEAVDMTSSMFHARALRAIGELKRIDLLPSLRACFQSEDAEIRFWAAWSALLLGDRAAIEVLNPFASTQTAYSESAMQIMLRDMDVPSSTQWLSQITDSPAVLRLAIVGAGIIGDPMYVPWLIKLMASPALARVAGEAFSMISGVDLAYEDLDTDSPQDYVAGPNEDPRDEDIDMDRDEDLPWPSPELLRDWWQKNAQRFKQGTRYLAGQPIDVAHCKQVLKTGFQRQRTAAALELALLLPPEPLFNTHALGAWQQRELRVGI